jgi:hypothetical protein
LGQSPSGASLGNVVPHSGQERISLIDRPPVLRTVTYLRDTNSGDFVAPTANFSASERGKERLELVFDLCWVVNRLSDFVTKQGAVAPAQPVRRGSDSDFCRSEVLSDLGVRDALGAPQKCRPQSLELSRPTRSQHLSFKPLQDVAQHGHCPSAFVEPLGRQFVSYLAGVPAFGFQPVDRDGYAAAPALSSTVALSLMSQKMLAGRHKERSELAFLTIRRGEVAFLDQARNETLDHIARFLLVASFAPDECVERIPIGPAQVSERLTSFSWVTSARGQNNAPASGLKSPHRL